MIKLSAVFFVVCVSFVNSVANMGLQLRTLRSRVAFYQLSHPGTPKQFCYKNTKLSIIYAVQITFP